MTSDPPDPRSGKPPAPFRIVCFQCRKVCQDDGSWRVEEIAPGERVSHGLCPECFRRRYGGCD